MFPAPPLAFSRMISQSTESVLHPHLNHEWFPENSLANLEELAATISVPSYAIDDHTAIKVTEGTVEVISEGQEKLFTPISLSTEIRKICTNLK
jgi:hypothetical protein